MNASALIEVWREAYCSCYPDDFLSGFTMKQKGQLGRILKVVPSGRAGEVIDWTIRHWLEFVETVKTEKGFKTVPLKPALWFLEPNLAVAVNLVTQSASSVQPKAEPPKKVVIIKKSKPDKKDIAGLSDILD